MAKLVLSMRTTGVDQVVSRLAQLFPEAEQMVATAIAESSKRCETDASSRVSSVDASGEIRQKMETTFRKRKGRLLGEVRSRARHSFFVEFGTGTMMELSPAARAEGFKPGKRQPYFPSLRKIGAWILGRTGTFFPGRRVYNLGGGKQAVLIGKEEERQAAFLVARAIFKKGGTPARPFLFPAYEKERPNFLFKLRAAALALGKRTIGGRFG